MLAIRALAVCLTAVRVSAAVTPTLPRDCPCGYVDRINDRLFTESIIVYFNETNAIDPEVFDVQSFEDKKEKGQGSIYRRGAGASNLGLGENAALQLFVNSSTPDHLVNGSELRTLRQDILYGSFRASMRSPAWGAGGTALSMRLKYNGSESLNVDLLNMDDPRSARVTNLLNGEVPTDAITSAYSALESGRTSVTPWDFVEYRVDWTDYLVDFWAGADRTRSVIPDDRTLPTVPQPLYLSHWSTGDDSYMQGPPVDRSVAEVAWVRAFFNSSLMTRQEHAGFDSRCQQWMACSMDDVSLRGSSPYASKATLGYKPPPKNPQLQIPAAVLAGICSSFGVIALINAMIRTVPWRILARRDRKPEPPASKQTSYPQRPHASQRFSSESGRAIIIDSNPTNASSEGVNSGQVIPYFFDTQDSNCSTPWRRADSLPGTPRHSDPYTYTDWAGGNNNISECVTATPSTPSRNVFAVPYYVGSTPQVWTSSSGLFPLVATASSRIKRQERDRAAAVRSNCEDEIMPAYLDGRTQRAGPKHHPRDETAQSRSEKDALAASSREWLPGDDTRALTALPSVPERLPSTEQRVDHLAGLVSVACFLVTTRNFALTFWPYVATGYGNTQHYAAESWLYIFVGGYVFTPLWFGPFFLTSARFLAARYLREGNLVDIAKKMLLRGPRLLVPVAIVALLEYFLMSLGLVAILDWLPSISWSTWPRVMPPGNFGVFVNNLFELAYYIPHVDGTPEIVDHYCTNVLWIIPVQLQLSYVVLLAAVIIRGMRSPWKRLGYYTCCIVLGWYARSWSGIFWIGLLLADLDLTYKWIEWTQSRPYALYTVLGAATIVAIVTPLLLVLDFGYWFMVNERGIHPDFQTGDPLEKTIRGGYPNYYEPDLAIMMFSTAIQIIAELSTCARVFLSTRLLLWLRPHVMTVYLIHGIVFWSLGAWVCVKLSVLDGMPYWANLIVTAVVCYVFIALLSILITSLIDFTTRATMKNIWRWASDEPVPWTPTTGKFTKSLILGRLSSPEETKEA